MKRTRAVSVEDLKLAGGYQAIRERLLREEFRDRLGKPLAFWALPGDRRLPLALLDRPLEELLATPYENLAATPGVGHKKICSLVKLLHRAAAEQAPSVPFGLEQLAAETAGPAHGKDEHGEFDPQSVSESMWLDWTATVRRHGLEQQRLGRLAPSLRELPKVIWNTPLGRYLEYSLSEVRNLRTHGEKRVRVVLEAFSIVHEMLGNVPPQRHLALRLNPKFALPIEDWLHQTIRRGRAPSVGEIRDHLIFPLLNQLQIDAGSTVEELAAARLGVGGQSESVRRQAQELGVTRARVYQLLEQCGDVLAVRWPEGRALLATLENLLENHPGTSSELAALRRVVELCYPIKLSLPPVSGTAPPVAARAYA